MAAVVPTASVDFGIPVRGQRIVLTATTTIFLVAVGNFTVSTLSAYGTIEARRVR
jgi:Na+-driven multidrug efflux pump